MKNEIWEADEEASEEDINYLKEVVKKKFKPQKCENCGTFEECYELKCTCRCHQNQTRQTKCEVSSFSFITECNNKAQIHNHGLNLCKKHNQMINQWVGENQAQQIKPEDYCLKERPQRKTFCQLKKGHEGSHSAVILWE